MCRNSSRRSWAAAALSDLFGSIVLGSLAKFRVFDVLQGALGRRCKCGAVTSDFTQRGGAARFGGHDQVINSFDWIDLEKQGLRHDGVDC